jgi:hypothetical protein
MDAIKQNRFSIQRPLTILSFGASQLTAVTQVVTLNVQGLAVCMVGCSQRIKSKALIFSNIQLRRSSVRNLL